MLSIMKNKLCLAIGLTVSALLAQDAKTVLQNAEKAMGSVKSIQYSGTGMNAFFGQALTAGKEWPRRDLTSYSRTLNYDQKSASEEFVFANQNVFGGARQNNEVNGDKAWNVGANGAAAPQLANAEERQLAIWLTPHGFLKAAMDAGNATVKARTEGGQKVNVVTFTAMGKFKVDGTIDGQGMVTKVETKIANPVMGDMAVVNTYSDYKDFNGVKFPTKILQMQGGFPVNDLTITRVQPNAPADLPVPAAVQSATMPVVRVETTKLGDGVWFLGGGSHHSLVVEFKDYIAVIEGPLNEERSLAVLAEARKLVPNKPVKYLVATHHHFDHSGGWRTYAAEGATIVTHASNKPYFEKTLKAPATLAPDRQSKSPKKANIIAVTDKYVLTDGKQSIEVYATQGDTHTDELLVAYIPSVKVLVEADSFSPGPPNAPPPATPAPNAVTLYNNIQRLKLDVATIVGIHGRGPVPMAEFLKFVGKS
jgi:glyoxylase-like metal-dependent hydrolase (beta-lactamase superfamily II)